MRFRNTLLVGRTPIGCFVKKYMSGCDRSTQRTDGDRAWPMITRELEKRKNRKSWLWRVVFLARLFLVAVDVSEI